MSVRGVGVLRVRFYKVRKFSVFPVVISAVNDDTAKSNRMTVDVFRCRMDDDVCAVLQGRYEEWRGERVIDKEGYVKFLGEFREFFKIENAQGGVADGFAEKNFCVWAECFAELCDRIFGIDERGLDAEFCKSNTEQCVAAAVNVFACNNVVTCFNKV